MAKSSGIGLIFDFDDTLSPDSTSGFLEHIGLDVKAFWKEHAAKIRAGWDPVPAYLQMMLEESKSRPSGKRITREKLAAWGSKVGFYKGVPQLFNRVRKQARAINPDIPVEFYVVSSGIGEIIRHTKIAKEFKDVFSSDFAYNRQGEISALKNIVSFTDKTRFVFQISKGIVGELARADPFAVNKKVPPPQLRIPLEQMIIIGDGYTDIPCFSLIQQHGGVAIGVYDRSSRDRWGKAWGFLDDQRVRHLVAADYRRNSGLDDAISLAIDKIAKNITLLSMTYQG